MSDERKPMEAHCAKCKHEWAPCFLPLMLSDTASLRAMKAPCPACGHAKQMMGMVPRETASGDWRAWLKNGDTGISSLTILEVMTGHTAERTDTPLDPSDFGRCYRLLKVMP